jgi:uncharacterized protein YpuA (DUF1002 family)
MKINLTDQPHSQILPDLNDTEKMEIDFHYFVDELDELEQEINERSSIEGDYFSILLSQEDS